MWPSVVRFAVVKVPISRGVGDTEGVAPTWWRWWIPSAVFAVVILVIAITGGASVWLSVVIVLAIVAGSLVAADNNRRIFRELRASLRSRRDR
jgi:hypothetical protein